MITQFQPTLPARGATCMGDCVSRGDAFQPTLPARGATRFARHTRWTRRISTHAPRTGSDAYTAGFGAMWQFQPTLPARGATSANAHQERDLIFQPTLPARGATDFRHPPERAEAISTHAPRTGSDRQATIRWQPTRNFNPRSPHGERPALVTDKTLALEFQPTLPARGATRFRFSYIPR